MIYPGLVYLPPPQSLYFLSSPSVPICLRKGVLLMEHKEIKLGVFLAFEVLGFGIKVA